MNLKKTEPVRVLAARRTLTLPEIAAAAGDLCPAILAEAARAGLDPSGPWIFVAHHLPQDAATAFDIEFCLPVAGPEAHDGPFELKSLAEIDCATAFYEGPLSGLFTHGYGPLARAIAASGRAFSGESREIYHRWDGPEAETNRIEIQFGLR